MMLVARIRTERRINCVLGDITGRSIIIDSNHVWLGQDLNF